MKPGKQFEKEIQDACKEQDVDYTRLRDAGWRGEETERRFTVKNICDAVLYKHGIILFAEMKHRQASLRFDEITQADELAKKWKPNQGVYSGVFCRLKGSVYFLSYEQLKRMEKLTSKKSFNRDDAHQFGVTVPMVLPNRCRKHRPDIDAVIRELSSKAANDEVYK